MKKIAADKNYRMLKSAGGVKVVYNTKFGGFDLSKEGKALYNSIAGEDEFDTYSVKRHDPILVHVVETLGSRASSEYSDLAIKVIKGNQYIIDEYDGSEGVMTPEDMRWITVEDQDFSFLSEDSTWEATTEASRSTPYSLDQLGRMGLEWRKLP